METINILCATDKNFAPYCGIMLTSLFESNSDCRFHVFVLVDSCLSEENERKFDTLGRKYGHEISVTDIEISMVEKLPVNERSHITCATYFRLFAALLLPDEVHKVIYLDGDMVVVGDIRPLWNLDMDGVAVSGVRGPRSSYSDICRYLGYSEEYGYFNAGVLVLNLDYWRTHDTTEKVLKFVEDHHAYLPMMDQDALNGALYDEKKMLPDRYNYMTMFFLRKNWESYADERRQECIEEGGKKVILHYLGRVKPWNYRYFGGPFHSEWEKFRRKSLWRDCRNKKPFVKYARHLVKRYLFPNILREQLSTEWVVPPESSLF